MIIASVRFRLNERVVSHWLRINEGIGGSWLRINAWIVSHWQGDIGHWHLRNSWIMFGLRILRVESNNVMIVFRVGVRACAGLVISKAQSNYVPIEWSIEVEYVHAFPVCFDCVPRELALVVETVVENRLIFCFRYARASFSWVENLALRAESSTLSQREASACFLIEYKAFLALFLALNAHNLDGCHFGLFVSRFEHCCGNSSYQERSYLVHWLVYDLIFDLESPSAF